MNPLELVFWDVQHGNATYIKTPAEKHIVLDLGTGSYGSSKEFSPLQYLKNKYKILQLDEVIITHPHTDHIADILNLEKDPVWLWEPQKLSDDEIRDANPKKQAEIVNKFLELRAKFSPSNKPEESPTKPAINGGVEFYDFSPRAGTTTNINNHGLLFVAKYGTFKILFSGDTEEIGWKTLLENTKFAQAVRDTTVLVASHHGRENGFYTELFNYFSPKLTIISDGRFSDRSATSRYSQKTSGCMVTKRKDGTKETRKCVTTRNDGIISVIVKNLNGTTYFDVSIA